MRFVIGLSLIFLPVKSLVDFLGLLKIKYCRSQRHQQLSPPKINWVSDYNSISLKEK